MLPVYRFKTNCFILCFIDIFIIFLLGERVLYLHCRSTAQAAALMRTVSYQLSCNLYDCAQHELLPDIYVPVSYSIYTGYSYIHVIHACY